MEQNQRQLIRKYIDLLFRRIRLIIISLMVAVITCVAMYLEAPKLYKATSLIIYQRQTINPSKLSPDVRTQTREMVNTLTQQVMSRTSLEQIVKQTGIYKEALKTLPLEDILVGMRQNIFVQPTKGDVFQVEFLGSNPKQVMLVTNALAAKFIEENLRYREEKVIETSAYVKDELEMAKASLNRKEELMRDYKLKYYNEMPEQLDINMSRLNSLQTQLQNNQNGQRDLERTKILIQEQISSRVEALEKKAEMQKKLAEYMASSMEDSGDEIAIDNQLDSIRAQYEALLTKYTERHPEVRRLKRILEKRESELVEQDSLSDQQNVVEETEDTNQNGDPFLPIVPVQDESRKQLEGLKLQLKEVSYSLAKLKKDEKVINNNIKVYKDWITATPVREAEWTALTRDYKQLSDHYELLVSRNLNAEAAENLERRQKGSQFKIIETAHLPEKPFTPNFMKYMLLALGLGGGFGVGIALVIETIQTSFKDALDLEKFTGVPVICSIPDVRVSTEKRIAKIKGILWWFSFVAGSLVISLGTAYLWYKGLIII